jgi:hypothetical protein
MAAIARHRRPDQTTNMEKVNQMQTTLQRLDGSNSYRKTAITVGVIYPQGWLWAWAGM